ncbi:MAG: hypothetical protein V3V41_02515 [Candidatus Heimdallarchaeota archaeon]
MFAELIKNAKIPQGITHIAGPPNSGKTTIIYHACKGIKEGKHALVLDCEMDFSAQRLQNIVINKKVRLQNIVIMTLSDKIKQFQTIMKLHNFTSNMSFSFIAINGITDHFRYISEKDELSNHRALSMQLAYLKMISKKEKIPILITNQVSAFKEEDRKEFKPIANSIMIHYSDRNIILQQINKRLLKALYEHEEVYYTLATSGIEMRN